MDSDVYIDSVKPIFLTPLKSVSPTPVFFHGLQSSFERCSSQSMLKPESIYSISTHTNMDTIESDECLKITV